MTAYVPPDPPVVPCLMVDRGQEALDWYVRAFGAVETARYDMDDGRLGHAMLTFPFGGAIYLSDDFPEMAESVGTRSPARLGGTTTTVALAVDDADAWMDRAAAEGAVVIRPASDQFYGRNGKLRDPFGHVWAFTGPLKDA